MSFDLPQERKDTATRLRELERNAPRDLRATLIQAAQELDAWHTLAEGIALQLTEIADVRFSVMASVSSVDEAQRLMKGQLREAARRLLEMP